MAWIGVEGFVEQHVRRTREQFLRRVREPYLIGPAWIAGPQVASEGRQRFATSILTPGPTDLTVGAGTVLAPLRKRTDSNAFGMMITLGRTPNNDLVVRHPNVSKFHAFFRQLGGEWLVNDGGSTNGTLVDGEPVPQGRVIPLRSGARIELAGDLTLELYLPGELYDWMRRARGGLSGTGPSRPSARGGGGARGTRRRPGVARSYGRPA